MLRARAPVASSEPGTYRESRNMFERRKEREKIGGKEGKLKVN